MLGRTKSDQIIPYVFFKIAPVFPDFGAFDLISFGESVESGKWNFEVMAYFVRGKDLACVFALFFPGYKLFVQVTVEPSFSPLISVIANLI